MNDREPAAPKRGPVDAVEWHYEWADKFDRKYQEHWNLIERRQVWSDLIARHSHQRARVLDLGCGTGVFTFIAAENSSTVTGIDANPRMIEICEQKKQALGAKNVDFVQEQLSNLDPGAVGKADLILCSSVLEYVKDVDQVLGVVHSLMTDDAVFVVSLPNRSSVARWAERIVFAISGFPRYYRHVEATYSLPEARALLARNGFLGRCRRSITRGLLSSRESVARSA